MSEELFPYQQQGAEWLASRKVALLADEMGLGKSAQAITACDLINAERILVLCPAVARINWEREFKRFSTKERKFCVISGRKDISGQSSSIICSYDLTPLISSSSCGPWDVVILDEAHFLKNPKAKRTRAVFGSSGVVRKAQRVWALTGTPAPNHPGELWPILRTFGRTPLSHDYFTKRFCTYYQAPHGLQVTGANNSRIPELRSLLSGVMLRRKKDDVMTQLPPITYKHITVEAGKVDLEVESSFVQYVMPTNRTKELAQRLKEEATLVELILKKAGFKQDGMAMLAAAASSVSTLRRYTGLQKVEAVAELVKSELEANAYEKVVIFAIHRDVIEGLRTRLFDFRPVTLYGGHDPATKQRNIDKFQREKKVRVFIGNIQACGTAITLTAAHNVIFAEQDWVPGNNAQAAMRCHRIGQTHPVSVRFVGLAASFDEHVAEVLHRKTRQLTKIFDGERVAISASHG